ncbi:MAG: hypothetical protein FJ271_10925 [Planctomycetes bacterium]|nr:hypothetical protein [Planctomycetota bacterium]
MTVLRRWLSSFALLICGGTLWTVSGAQDPARKDGKDGKDPETVSYYKNVRPIFQQHCQGCHQPAKAQGGYIMTSHADLLKKGDHDEPGVVPGQADRSMLVKQITPHGGKPAAMPRGKPPLLDREVALIKKWIAQGAKDDTPASARGTLIDMEHPPVYKRPPVITSLTYSPDGTLLAVAGYHEILLHKTEGGLVARLVGISERIQSLAFSPDGKLLAASGGNPGRFGEVQIWDVARKKLKLSVPVTFDTVYGVSWSHDGKKLAFGCADNTLRAIDPETGKQILFQGAHGDWVLDTVFSKDSSHLVSVSRDMSMKLTEVATQRMVDNITSITPGALKGGLMTVDRHPTRDDLLIGGADGIPKIYQMYRTKARQIGDDFNLIRKFPELPGRVYVTRYNKNGSRIIVGTSNNGKGQVTIFPSEGGKALSTFQGIQGAVYAAAFHPGGALAASAGFDGVVRINDVNSGKLIREFVPCPLSTDVTSK